MLLNISDDQVVDGKIRESLLTDSVKFLYIESSSLASLPATLPTSLTMLAIIDNNIIQSLPYPLPAGLKEIYLNQCDALESLPAILPASLEKFMLSQNGSIKLLPNPLPATIKKLYLDGCDALESLPATLPAALKKFMLINNSNIKSLPDPLPANLEVIDLSGCDALKALPATLPNNLKSINLSGCDALEVTEELLALLKMIPDSVDLTLPEHLQLALTKEKLLPLNMATPATVNLLNRYLDEDATDRGNTEELIKDATPVIDFILANPSHHKWIEEIASHYVDEGCINQPVAGFAKISAWMSVANTESTADKIQAARQLMAMDTITGFVASATPSVGRGVEVEAGNALLREVHKMLVEEDKMEPWPGIAEKISYEETISSWLTEEKISAAFLKVRETLAMPLTDVTNYLCQSHCTSTWAAIAFPEDVIQIEEKYASKIQQLQDLIADTDTPLPEQYKVNNDDGSEKILSEEERMELLTSLYHSTETEKLSEIHTLTNQKTIEAITEKTQPLLVYEDGWQHETMQTYGLGLDDLVANDGTHVLPIIVLAGENVAAWLDEVDSMPGLSNLLPGGADQDLGGGGGSGTHSVADQSIEWAGGNVAAWLDELDSMPDLSDLLPGAADQDLGGGGGSGTHSFATLKYVGREAFKEFDGLSYLDDLLGEEVVVATRAAASVSNEAQDSRSWVNRVGEKQPRGHGDHEEGSDPEVRNNYGSHKR